jgi:hypothetical protein
MAGQSVLLIISAALSGLGVGTVLTTIVKARFDRVHAREQRLAQARLEKFSRLLVCYGEIAKGWSDDRAKDFATAEAEVQLVASDEVIGAIAKRKSVTVDQLQAESAHSQMIVAMRKDISTLFE